MKVFETMVKREKAFYSFCRSAIKEIFKESPISEKSAIDSLSDFIASNMDRLVESLLEEVEADYYRDKLNLEKSVANGLPIKSSRHITLSYRFAVSKTRRSELNKLKNKAKSIAGQGKKSSKNAEKERNRFYATRKMDLERQFWKELVKKLDEPNMERYYLGVDSVRMALNRERLGEDNYDGPMRSLKDYIDLDTFVD